MTDFSKISDENLLIAIEENQKAHTKTDEDILSELIQNGEVKPREDGAGFLTRTKFSFADTDTGRKQVLEEEYGKGKAFKVGDRWLIQDKKGFNFVDEESLSWTDAADIIGDIPEEAGMLLGAIGGGLTGGGVASPVTAIGGAALGAGMGKSAKNLIAKALGIKDEKNLPQELIDIGKSMSYGASAEMGGRAIGKIGEKGINKLLAPFKNDMTPAAIARRDLAKKYGVELTPAQVTQSPALSRVENTLNSGFTGDKIASIKEGQFETLQSKLKQSLETIYKNKTDEVIGMDIANALDDSMKLSKDGFSTRYGEIASQIDNKIPIGNLKEKALSLKNSTNEVPKSLQGQATGTADEILEIPDQIDYETLSAIRTALGEKAKSGAITSDVGAGKYKQLKGSLNSDFDSFTKAHGLGDIKKGVDSDFRNFKMDYENGITKKILKDGQSGAIVPEKIGGNSVSTITNARKVGGNLGNNDLLQEAMAKDMMNKIFVSNPKIVTPHKEYLSTDKLNTYIGKNKDTFNHVFNEGQKKEISELVDIGGNLGHAEKAYGNPSGTSKALDGILSTGLMYADPVVGGSALAGRYLGSKAYTSKAGQKYLTDGFAPSEENTWRKIFSQPIRRASFYEVFKGEKEKSKK
jgi:hypothetical protein